MLVNPGLKVQNFRAKIDVFEQLEVLSDSSDFKALKL